MKAIVLALALIAYAAAVTIDASSGGAMFVVDTAIKTGQHPYFGQGFTFGFRINGSEGATVIVSQGFTYQFVVKSACNHPFFLSTDTSGQFSTGEVTAGISASPSYALVCNAGPDGILTFTPQVSQVGTELYYQCRTHSKMGYKIIVKAQTICNKYSSLLMISNQALVFSVVNSSFNQIALPASPIKDYFNGVVPAGSTNYIGNQAQAAGLINKLVGFFGPALGCSDGTIGAYTGNSNMQQVHGAMPIGSFEFSTFNNIVLGVMAGAGVVPADIQATNATLISLKSAICNQGDCRLSICDRYSDLLMISNVALVTTVVNSTFFKLVAAGAPTRAFFNGTTPPGSTNFLANTAALGTLASHLVAFFGAALGCSDQGFPAYTGETNMTIVHRNMPIGKTEFEFFNAKLVEVLREAGVTQADQTAVAGVLETFRTSICSGLDCFGNQGINFVLDVVPKSNHPWTDGFPSGYKVDGVQGRTLVLQPGTTYRFTNLGSCQHPLYISSSDQGAGNAPITLGVQYPNGNQFGVCAGAFLDYTPQASQNGQTLYYQCQNHARMGGPIFVGSTPPPVTTGTAGQQTFCQKYATALMINHNQLVTTVINSTVLMLVAPTSPDKGFFDGTIPAGSTNFLANQIRFNRLFTNLVTFFGAALGCTDGTIGIYEGQPDMRVTHQNMPISPIHFNFFVDTVVSVLAGAGVDMTDQATARGLLNSFRGSICNQNDCFPTTAVATTAADTAGAASLVPAFVLAFLALIALLF